MQHTQERLGVSTVWGMLRESVSSTQEPSLAPLMGVLIGQCDSFEESLTRLMAYKIADDCVSREDLVELFAEVLAADPEILACAAADLFAMDIHPGATIGSGVFIDHATGVVIGETAFIGDDVSILQNVTLGGTGKESGDRHPKIRSGVLLAAGAKVLGDVIVGEDAKIRCGQRGAGPRPGRYYRSGDPRPGGPVSDPRRACRIDGSDLRLQDLMACTRSAGSRYRPEGRKTPYRIACRCSIPEPGVIGAVLRVRSTVARRSGPLPGGCAPIY